MILRSPDVSWQVCLGSRERIVALLKIDAFITSTDMILFNARRILLEVQTVGQARPNERMSKGCRPITLQFGSYVEKISTAAVADRRRRIVTGILVSFVCGTRGDEDPGFSFGVGLLVLLVTRRTWTHREGGGSRRKNEMKELPRRVEMKQKRCYLVQEYDSKQRTTEVACCSTRYNHLELLPNGSKREIDVAKAIWGAHFIRALTFRRSRKQCTSWGTEAFNERAPPFKYIDTYLVGAFRGEVLRPRGGGGE